MLKELSPQIIWNYLHNFAKIMAGRTANLKPLFFTVYTNLRCNFSCSYCSFAQSGQTKHHHDELDTDKMFSLITIIRRASRYIYFTGGEPLLRKDIVQIVKKCKEIGFKSISINTNMSLIHTKMEILDYVTNLIASFDMADGGSEYAKILGVTETVVSRVRDNIIACAKLQEEKGFHMVVNCVVTPQTIHHVREVMRFCFDHNIKFAVVPAELDGGAINYELKNSNEYQRLIQDIIAAKKRGKPVFGSYGFLKTISDFRRFKCYPTLTPHVYPNGDLFYPCEPLQKVAANLLHTGSYSKAMQVGMQKFGTLPMCKDKCHKACYIEPSSVSRNPISIISGLR